MCLNRRRRFLQSNEAGLEAVQNIGRDVLGMVEVKFSFLPGSFSVHRYLYISEYLMRVRDECSNTVQNRGRLGNMA